MTHVLKCLCVFRTFPTFRCLSTCTRFAYIIELQPIVRPTPMFRLSLLVADDDKASCLILRKMLTDQGHSCSVVHDGVEAVQAACAKRYDVVFLDLYMPVLSGIHAAIAIRSLRSTSPVLIGIASTIDCKEVSLCRDVAGETGFVLKPFDRESIPRLMQTLKRQQAPQAPAAAHEAKTTEDTPRNTATVTEDSPAARSTLTINEHTTESRRRMTNSCESPFGTCEVALHARSLPHHLICARGIHNCRPCRPNEFTTIPNQNTINSLWRTVAPSREGTPPPVNE